jgi:predicted permease
MHPLFQDLRYGARMLLKNPGFTVIAVVTLALGIGATTAIFSVVNAALLRPLPYPDAERLLTIEQSGSGAGEPKFLFWREHSQSFEAMAAYSSFGGAGGSLSGGDEAEYAQGLRVSEDFFRVLGVCPALGRAFTRLEDTFGAAPVAIISDGLWRRRFGANRELVGRRAILNGKVVTIVGIMPPQFRMGFEVDLFTPMQARPNANFDPNATAIGRLKPGVTIEQARAELKLIAEKYRAAFPQQMQKDESVSALPYQELFTDGLSQYLWILLGAVSFLLLIACANVANLQLTRAAARRREIAVRMAMGAGGGRVARQLLTECMLLSLIGGASGLFLAVWGTEVLLKTLPEGLLSNMTDVRVDWYVLAFASGAAILTGLLFGLAPAWQARKVDVNTALKENAGRGTTGRGRLRSALVVTEVALSLMLLVGAGLLIRTFANLRGVAPGFDPHSVLTFQLTPNGERYKPAGAAAAFYRDALERISRLPGVEAAAVINKLPLDWQFNMPVVFSDQPDKSQNAQVRMISPDYFKVMKIPVRQGRAFSETDNAAAPPVIIVNEAFVKRFFGGQTPFARQLSVGRGLNDPARQIVGVVGDTKQNGLSRPAPAMIFIPIPQVSEKLLSIFRSFSSSNFTVRMTGSPMGLGAAIKREVAALDPTLALSQIFSMEEITARSIATERFNMLLVGLFAALGLALAAVGVYGVIAYSVEQRANEIGLRIALGAQARDVIRLVLRQGLSLTLLGVLLGLAGAYGVTRLINSLLFGVSATDPLTFIVISLLLVTVALLACWIPARRATKVDPIVALRCE